MADDVSPITLPAVTPPGSSRVLASPFQFYLTGAENLLVTSFNSLAGVTLTISMRFLDATGAVTWNTWTHTPHSDRTAKSEAFFLQQGYILNLVIFASSGAPTIGQTFVQVSIIGGLDHTQYVLGTMLQGYVTSRQELGWPGSPIDSSLAGGDYVRTIFGTQPALGGQLSETVPSGARWQLSTLLVAGTVVGGANRQAVLGFVDPSSIAAFYLATNPQIVAAGAFTWQWGVSVPLDGTAAPFAGTGALPAQMPLLAGQQIFTRTFNWGAGDQFGPPVYVVREWLEAQ